MTDMVACDVARLRTAAIHTRAAAEVPVAFAAAELQRYLQALTGIHVPIVQHASVAPHALLLGADPDLVAPSAEAGSDEFVILPAADHVALAAGSARGLLHATYTLLEQFGCRWSLHSPQEERVAPLGAAVVDLRPVRRASRFTVHGYSADLMTWHYTEPEHFAAHLADDRAFIDWMGKSGATAFLFIRHPFDTQLSIPELVPEFQRRGIDVEYGGHVIPLLLPRSLYRAHPEYFPESPTHARSDLGNVCASNAAALATIAANAVTYVREHPEVRVLHIWGADVWRGAWCCCASCCTMSMQDQSLTTCNAVARGLAEGGVARPVCYLAYHDTLEPNLSVRPDPNVLVEFAPRERCYGHALNDPGCATNRRYAAALERYVDLFDGRVRLFEYYGDAILFCGCAVPLTAVIAADLDYFHRLGVREITMLQFGAFSHWAYAVNFAAFAAGRGGAVVPAQAIADYCAGFGRHAEAGALFTELEAAMQPVVTYGDIRRPPRAADAAARLLPAIESALPRLESLASRFTALDSERLTACAPLARYTGSVLAGVCAELRAAMAGADDVLGHGAASGTAASGSAASEYARAVQTVQSVSRRIKGVWGSVDLPLIHDVFSVAQRSD